MKIPDTKFRIGDMVKDRENEIVICVKEIRIDITDKGVDVVYFSKCKFTRRYKEKDLVKVQVIELD